MLAVTGHPHAAWETVVRSKGRPVLGTLAGLLFGAGLAVELLVLGIVPLDSAVVTVVPFAGMVVGAMIGLWAPFRRRTVRDDVPEAVG